MRGQNERPPPAEQELREGLHGSLELEGTSVWSFPLRGSWATHKGDYRGNWPPQVPRNLILRYTRPGDVVLDPMCGSGTTLIECALLGRQGLGFDINSQAVALARSRLAPLTPSFASPLSLVEVGDARKLGRVERASVNLVTLHPPYMNVIRYSDGIPGDLSQIGELDEFRLEMKQVIEETWRILRPGGIVALLIGDIRRQRVYMPLGFWTMNDFLAIGFILRDSIVKVQWNCASTSYWIKRSKSYNFHLIVHEHLFILQKPATV